MGKIREKWRALPPAARASTAYLICNVVQKGFTFFTMPLFTNLLSSEQYGQLITYNSWSGVLSIFLTLNLAYGSFSTAMVRFEGDRDRYISSVQGICMGLCVLFLALYFPFRGYLNRLLELPTAFVVVLVLDIFFNTSILLWIGKKQFEYKYLGVVAITMLQVVAVIVISYVLVTHTEEKGFARILGEALPNICIGGALFFVNTAKGKKLFSREHWKYALGFNIPLLAYHLSQAIFTHSDRVMISHLEGQDKAAFYGVVYSLAIVLNFVVNAINGSYVPWFYRKLQAGRQQENNRISMGIALVLAILLSGLIWFAPEIILFFTNRNYLEAVSVVPPAALSVLLLQYAQFFINVEFYYEQKKSLVWASISAAAFNLVLNWICIPRFGYLAAAYTKMISYLIFALSHYFAMVRMLKRMGATNDMYNYRELFLLLIAFVGTTFLGEWLYPYLIVRIVISAAVLTVVFIKRRYFIGIYHDFK